MTSGPTSHIWYRYDEANRLVRASVYDPSGQRTQEDYTYDAFGNITQINAYTIQVNANTNRLSSAGYDESGNMTTWGGSTYTYDTGNQMVKQDGRWYFLYTLGGERIATIDWQGSIATREVDWTIRGPSNQVLSTFKLTGEDQTGNWSREMDYIWMGRKLLGTEEDPGGPSSTIQHYHTDHLGTIRLITDSAGNKISEHEYLPYGQELTSAGNGVMKFTGHERDGDTGMDYMHARFYQEHLGRFMSADMARTPAGAGGRAWNRYAYTRGGPMTRSDRNGLCDGTMVEGYCIEGEFEEGIVTDACPGPSVPFVGACVMVGDLRSGPTGGHPFAADLSCDSWFGFEVCTSGSLRGMKRPTRKAIARTLSQIDELHPCAQDSTTELLNQLTADKAGEGLVAVGGGDSGYRTNERQDELWAIGRRGIPGEKTVTSAKGGESFHNYGLAWDVIFFDNEGQPQWQSTHYSSVGDTAKPLGFDGWGGNWTKKDWGHVEIHLGGLTSGSALQDAGAATVGTQPCK